MEQEEEEKKKEKMEEPHKKENRIKKGLPFGIQFMFLLQKGRLSSFQGLNGGDQEKNEEKEIVQKFMIKQHKEEVQ